MDERCQRFHVKLLSGTCPWCGAAIVNGEAEDSITFFDSEGIDFTVSEWTEKTRTGAHRDFDQLVRQFGPFDYGTAVQCVSVIAEQLASFHETSGRHGGVHPSNIFLDEDGAVRLGGSGTESFGGVTHVGMIDEQRVLRSIDYLSPEQVLVGHTVDSRSDVYSLGCTLYFLVTGEPPFAEGSVAERLLQHQSTMPKSLEQIRSDVPIELALVCAKMLAKRPDDRFQSAAEVLVALAGLR